MNNKFNLFDQIEDRQLRAWNRCAMIFNIGGSHGPKAMSTYAENFSADDKKDITDMFLRIKENGYESTKALISRRVQEYAH